MGQRAGKLSGPAAATAGEVFRVFLKLGCTSFGGPIAHLGYFRAELVERRGWIDSHGYADLVALCQFLPGPASSQVGFCLGLMRAGWRGGLAAWAGFTLPSALLLVLFARYGVRLVGTGVSHGLALAAVAVVAQAVWSMARSLCPDRERATIAGGLCVFVLLVSASWSQFAAMVLAAVAGLVLCRRPEAATPAIVLRGATPGSAIACLLTFAALLGVSLLWPGGFAAAFYRSGALVFGGGHVVLPLLRDALVTPGRVSPSAFLAGYGATQAMPGPLFTFAAYLGAVMAGWGGAGLAVAAIFLPGLLLVAGVLPFWTRLRAVPAAAAVLRGVNAGVVGLLGAALYDPVWTGAVERHADVAVVLAAFVLLTAWKAPPVLVVGLCAVAGVLLGAP